MLSSGTTPVDGFSGKSSQCHVAIIPSLHVGSAEVRNVAVIVIEDKDFYIPQIRFQFKAVLGYPVLAALGRLSFYADGRFGVSPGNGATGQSEGARLFMEELTPLVAVGIGKEIRLFRLDTGATNSYLTVRYWEEHRDAFAGRKPGTRDMGGSGGTHSIPAYQLPEATLSFAGVPVTLRDVPVLTESHNAAKEYFHGHLGQDVLKRLSRYTLDFQAMRFSASISGSPR